MANYISIQMSVSGNATPRELPEGYTQVEYLKASGVQYINTGVTPKGTTRVLIRAGDFPIESSSKTLFGSRTNTSSADQYLFVAYSGQYYTTLGSSSRVQMNISSTSAIFTVDKNGAQTIMTVEGGSSATVNNTASSMTSTLPLFLFANNLNGSVDQASSASIYSCQIYDEGVMVRDYVPCVNINDVAGMYDLANDVFYPNVGSGTFTVGPVVVTGLRDLAALIEEFYFSDGVARKVTKGYIGVVPSASGGVEIRDDLPDGYTQKEYLKASGTQYIDMGITPTHNTRVLVVAKNYPIGDGKSLFGSRTSSASADMFNLIGSLNPSGYRTDYYNSRTTFDLASTTDRITVDANKNNWTITVDGGSSETITHTLNEFSSTLNMYLFGINTNGSFAGGSSAEIYSCKVWQDDVLVRDYIPCVDSEGTPGMYDAVSDTFFTNAGTGTFEVGNTVRPAETTAVAMLFYNGETVTIDITGSYFNNTHAYIQIGDTKYTAATADIQIEAGTEVIVHVGATSSNYYSYASVTLDGETVLSGQGSYTWIADTDATISMARITHSYSWYTYYSYQATITTA